MSLKDQTVKDIQNDADFRSVSAARDFFKRKDRSKPFDMQDVVGVRYALFIMINNSWLIIFFKEPSLGIPQELLFLVDLTIELCL